MKISLSKIWSNIQLFFYNLVLALKNTEVNMLHNTGTTIGENTAIIKEVEQNRVSKALLKGEVTQEVEELRYRTYLVDKESKGFEYYAPTLALKRDSQDSKFMIHDDSDGLELITIQPNDVLVETVNETLQQVGGRGKRTEHRVKVVRNFPVRYKIESYMTRIDVKRLDEKHVILDMFFSKYPNPSDFKSKGFVRELEKIRDEKIKSDILDIENVNFATKHAYKLNDLVKFSFNNLWFKEIVEFDGHYIMRFKASFEQDSCDLTKKYYSKTMDMKYQTNEKKDVQINLLDYFEKEKYVCEVCGKEVFLDKEKIDNLEIYQGRDITEENNKEGIEEDVLEFMDMQISEQTYGKRMCSECLRKYLKENNLI